MSGTGRIHIVTPAVVPNDAIGTDVLEMAAALRAAGYDADVFAGGIDPSLRQLVKPLSAREQEHWRSPDDILIYHHSMGWPEGEELLNVTRNSIVVRYHNITPPGYFERYSEPHFEACRLGLESTRRVALLPGALFWGDSSYNCQGLIGCGAPPERCRVLPPLHCTEQLAAQPFDWGVLQAYRDGVVNILFVGGFKPNKGHLRAIRVFARYHLEWNSRSRLILVGSFEPAFQRYVEELWQLAAELSVEPHVVFSGSVSAAQLRSYYMVSQVFLCLSEHEGFCVPLVEAMYFRVPIVAWGQTAVSETLAGCGMVWDEIDEDLFAESIHACVEQREFARHMRRLGWDRYDSTYRGDILRRRLIDLLQEVADVPINRYRAAGQG